MRFFFDWLAVIRRKLVTKACCVCRQRKVKCSVKHASWEAPMGPEDNWLALFKQPLEEENASA